MNSDNDEANDDVVVTTISEETSGSNPWDTTVTEIIDTIYQKYPNMRGVCEIELTTSEDGSSTTGTVKLPSLFPDTTAYYTITHNIDRCELNSSSESFFGLKKYVTSTSEIADYIVGMLFVFGSKGEVVWSGVSEVSGSGGVVVFKRASCRRFIQIKYTDIGVGTNSQLIRGFLSESRDTARACAQSLQDVEYDNFNIATIDWSPKENDDFSSEPAVKRLLELVPNITGVELVPIQPGTVKTTEFPGNLPNARRLVVYSTDQIPGIDKDLLPVIVQQYNSLVVHFKQEAWSMTIPLYGQDWDAARREFQGHFQIARAFSIHRRINSRLLSLLADRSKSVRKLTQEDQDSGIPLIVFERMAVDLPEVAYADTQASADYESWSAEDFLIHKCARVSVCYHGPQGAAITITIAPVVNSDYVFIEVRKRCTVSAEEIIIEGICLDNRLGEVTKTVADNWFKQYK